MFSRSALESWRAEWIQAIFVNIVAGGCSGKKVRVETTIPEGSALLKKVEGLMVFCAPAYLAPLGDDSLRLTQTPKGWILTSAHIADRCGCGTSFSFEGKRPSSSIILPVFAGLTRLDSHEESFHSGISPYVLDTPPSESTRAYTGKAKSHSEIVSIAIDGSTSQQTHLTCCEEGANLIYSAIIVPKPGETAQITLIGSAQANHTHVIVKALIIVTPESRIDMKALIGIATNCRDVEARLQIEAIYLWSSGRLNCVPAIEAASDDITASHSFTCERISDEVLFYMSSRGLNTRESIDQLLRGKISAYIAPSGAFDGLKTQKNIEQILRAGGLS